MARAGLRNPVSRVRGESARRVRANSPRAEQMERRALAVRRGIGTSCALADEGFANQRRHPADARHLVWSVHGLVSVMTLDRLEPPLCWMVRILFDLERPETRRFLLRQPEQHLLLD